MKKWFYFQHSDKPYEKVVLLPRVYSSEQTGCYNDNEENKKQRRKIIWFNPHFPKVLKVILVKHSLV